MAELLLNLRYTLRVLNRNRGSTAVAILSLALGIGANTAVFTLLNALVLRSLPVPHPQQLVGLAASRPDGTIPFSYPMFREVERGQRVFSDFFAWSGNEPFSVDVNGEFFQDPVTGVTGDYYTALGTHPLLGRLITQGDVDARGGSTALVAVLGYEYWQWRFGGDAGIVGKPLRIEGQPFTIIGVTPRWFTGMTPGEPPRITVPVTAFPLLQGDVYQMESRAILWLSPCGRLKEGVTLPQARTQLRSFWPDVLLATASTDEPGPRRQRFLSLGLDVSSAATGTEKVLREKYSRPLFALLGIVGLILLLACLNLANLLLARAAARTQEMGVRMALGCSRWRLARQVLSESLVLSFAGAAVGLALAYGGTRFLVRALAPYAEEPMMLDLRPDPSVLNVTVATALLTGVLSSLGSVLRTWRENFGSVLQSGARSIAASTGRLGKALMVSQVALSLVLLVGAGLLVRTFQKLSSLPLGFDQEHLLEIALRARPGKPQIPDPLSYHTQLLEHLAALPGVRSAAFSGGFFPAPQVWRDIASPSSTQEGPGTGVRADTVLSSPNLLRTLGISLVQGRDLDWSDDQRHTPVVILSGHLADQLFPKGGALGQYVRFGVMPDLQSLEVVGIAGDAHLFDLRSPAANVIYAPALQHLRWNPSWDGLVIRAQGDPQALARSAAHEIESMGYEYVSQTRTAEQLTGLMLVPERALAILSGFFAALALLLASVGLYGLMSYTVLRRTREIGVRAALGAQRAALLWTVLREVLVLVLAGVAIGIPCALAASRLVAAMLFGVTTYDPVTLVTVVAVLLASALIAGFQPARRAARIDPIVALRAE